MLQCHKYVVGTWSSWFQYYTGEWTHSFHELAVELCERSYYEVLAVVMTLLRLAVVRKLTGLSELKCNYLLNFLLLC